MLLGFGGNQYEGSRAEVMQLIEKWKSWHPGSTDAEAEAALQAMSSGERTRMSVGRHEMDPGQAVLGDACAPEPEPYQSPVDDGLPAPLGPAAGDRGWYR